MTIPKKTLNTIITLFPIEGNQQKEIDEVLSIAINESKKRHIGVLWTLNKEDMQNRIRK